MSVFAVAAPRAKAAAKRGAGRVLFLAQLPPPLHGQSAMAARVHDTMRGALGLEVERLWAGGAASNADVGRRSAAKYLGFIGLACGIAWRAATRKRYDIAYLGVAPWSHALARDAVLAALAKLAARRVLVHVHGVGLERIAAARGFGGRLIRAAFAGTEVLAVSGATRAAAGGGVFGAVHDLPNTSPDPGEAAPARGSQLRVATLCNLDPRKGVTDFVEVVGGAAALGLAVRGAIGGGATAAMSVDDLRERIAATGAADAFDVLGHVDDAAKAVLLREAQVFLYLSRHDLAPLALIEALAHGCAPIVLDIGGLAEMVGPGLAHCVLDPALDGETLAAQCVALLGIYAREPGRLERDRRAARARYLEVFAPERFADALAAIAIPGDRSHDRRASA